jgi:hypothetical protein
VQPQWGSVFMNGKTADKKSNFPFDETLDLMLKSSTL